jgi:YidC/Oxa1 family membrane protein insertase
MSSFLNTILYEPIFKFLIFIYQNLSFNDFGVAIIILTILIRLVLFPLFYKGAKDQAIMQKIAPKLKEIQEKHKQDKEKQVQATLALYKEHKVNPLFSFGSLIIQIIILITLFKVFSTSVKPEAGINLLSFGFIDLAKTNLLVTALAALAQYWQSKLSIPKNGKSFKNLSLAEKVGRQMAFTSPLITIIFLINLPSALGIYWLTSAIFSAIQQIIINKNLNINKEIKEEAKKLKS